MEYLPSLTERKLRFSEFMESCCGGSDMSDSGGEMEALPETDPTPLETKLNKVIKKKRRK
jgi:hypothetical protein